VVDASLALKWELNDEEFVEQAVAIRDAHLNVDTNVDTVLLTAPTFFPYEIANGIRRALVGSVLMPAVDLGCSIEF